MAELLKNRYTRDFIRTLANSLQRHYAAFDKQDFEQAVFTDDWQKKELKQRMRHITVTLKQHLPDDYQQALSIIIPAAQEFNGFEYMFFPDYVELYGLDDFTPSMQALGQITAYASAEFAIRAFILRYEQQSMQQMLVWAQSECLHQRRLASEGCRPRLPWAVALPVFKQNPAAVIEVLQQLKTDSSLYVRRSVANNLNDISKDNPEVFIKLAQQWTGQHNDTDWIIKHASRGLLRQGHAEILALFGLYPAQHVNLHTFTLDNSVKRGELLQFAIQLFADKGVLGKLRIEYAIDFLRANGRHNKKVFKLGESDYQLQSKSINKPHSFKFISTRKYYAGRHYLTIIVNGVEIAKKPFEVL